MFFFFQVILFLLIERRREEDYEFAKDEGQSMDRVVIGDIKRASRRLLVDCFRQKFLFIYGTQFADRFAAIL